ncbi:hypothetical protein B0H67DRAFT_642138 [Lasiosphaeris hirsuta]|uniref:RanBP2-type domain-containing protein n=1 Tax=Lasiosphaeris hirsuta TaxID=260670 RepID=A0AA40E6G4_9PEZI|nr:hypothetical protein B0H67DRAFT_642138 [Lasiosphaeris hirsuta]
MPSSTSSRGSRHSGHKDGASKSKHGGYTRTYIWKCCNCEFGNYESNPSCTECNHQHCEVCMVEEIKVPIGR